MVNKKKFAEEEAAGYRIEILGRHVHVTEAMKNYALEKLSKIERFHTHIMHIHVTLDIQKLEQTCTIVLKIDHTQVKAHASSTDMYVSIDMAVEKLQSLLRRYKGKIQDHHKKGKAIVDMEVNVVKRPYDEVSEFNQTIDFENQRQERAKNSLPHVVGTEKKPLKMLTVDEALMKMDLSGDLFLVFRSEEDQKLKVLYRRNDGDYGLMLPE